MTLSGKIQDSLRKMMIENDFYGMLNRSIELIDEEPSNYNGYWWAGKSLRFLGRYVEAVKFLHDALKHADDDNEESLIMSSLADVFNLQRKYNRALDYAEVALELDPDNVEAVISKGFALIALGRRSDAEQLMDRYMRKFIDSYNLARAYAILRRKGPMIETLSKALRERPSNKYSILRDPEFNPYLKDPELIAIMKTS
jgi:tetratricopeptide (TPR) repeat protein